MTYRIKTVEAVQFDPQSEPWPGGVEASETSPTGYLFVGMQGRLFVVAGDYVITSPGPPRLVRQSEFDEFYEPAQ